MPKVKSQAQFEKEWRAEEDLRAITRVEEMKGDKPRQTAAQALGVKRAKEAQKTADLAQRVARAGPKSTPTRKAARKSAPSRAAGRPPGRRK